MLNPHFCLLASHDSPAHCGCFFWAKHLSLQQHFEVSASLPPSIPSGSHLYHLQPSVMDHASVMGEKSQTTSSGKQMKNVETAKPE